MRACEPSPGSCFFSAPGHCVTLFLSPQVGALGGRGRNRPGLGPLQPTPLAGVVSRLQTTGALVLGGPSGSAPLSLSAHSDLPSYSILPPSSRQPVFFQHECACCWCMRVFPGSLVCACPVSLLF